MKYKYVIIEQEGFRILLILAIDHELSQFFQGWRAKAALLIKHGGTLCVILYKEDEHYVIESTMEVLLSDAELNALNWIEDVY